MISVVISFQWCTYIRSSLYISASDDALDTIDHRYASTLTIVAPFESLFVVEQSYYKRYYTVETSRFSRSLVNAQTQRRRGDTASPFASCLIPASQLSLCVVLGTVGRPLRPRTWIAAHGYVHLLRTLPHARRATRFGFFVFVVVVVVEIFVRGRGPYVRA